MQGGGAVECDTWTNSPLILVCLANDIPQVIATRLNPTAEDEEKLYHTVVGAKAGIGRELGRKGVMLFICRALEFWALFFRDWE